MLNLSPILKEENLESHYLETDKLFFFLNDVQRILENMRNLSFADYYLFTDKSIKKKQQ